MKPYFLLLSLFLIPALACSTTGLAESLVSSGSVLYQDIFSNPQSGWGEFNSVPGIAGYKDGAYRIMVGQPDTNLWTHPGMNFASVRTEVSLMTPAGPLTNRMGLICRLKDEQNFYFFVISADGNFGIGKVKDGQAAWLSGEKMQLNDAILTGSQINRLRADCVDSTLSFYVNNTLVATVLDATFPNGDVGILAGTFEQPGADVYFDNFVAIKP